MSFGVAPQPGEGMKSIFDMIAETNESTAARKWFYIKEAAVRVSKDGALVPECTIGVQARRLEQTPDGLKDAEFTSPTDLSVKYADSFSQNFDAVADKVPVIAELRALFRASVLARFLLEQGAVLDESVLKRLGQPMVPTAGPKYPPKVPTLRKNRTRATVDQRASSEYLMAT